MDNKHKTSSFLYQKTNKLKTDSNSNLTNFVLFAKSTTEGKFLADIIKQVLESPSIFVFGELLDVDNVKALNGTEYEPYLRLLEIFVFGTYQEYKKQKCNSQVILPDLSEPMLTKLRQLSIVSLAKYRRYIPYQILLEELDLANIRELENLIIEVIYANIIKGTMDQRNNRLEIDETMGRDVREEDFNTIINVLSEWCLACERMLSNIEEQIEMANKFNVGHILTKLALQAKIQLISKHMKLNENDSFVEGFMNDELNNGNNPNGKQYAL